MRETLKTLRSMETHSPGENSQQGCYGQTRKNTLSSSSYSKSLCKQVVKSPLKIVISIVYCM